MCLKVLERDEYTPLLWNITFEDTWSEPMWMIVYVLSAIGVVLFASHKPELAALYNNEAKISCSESVD